jgi:hypothetical protein
MIQRAAAATANVSTGYLATSTCRARGIIIALGALLDTCCAIGSADGITLRTILEREIAIFSGACGKARARSTDRKYGDN